MSEFLERVIRVNHAGEYGAKRIYQGQMAILKNKPAYAKVKHMMEQELEHLSYFENEMAKRKVRPSLLTPLWHVGGFALGAATALMGEKAAYACTVAVEEVIDEHYKSQLDKLGNIPEEKVLAENIEKFRQEEVEHKNTSLENSAEEAPMYPVIHSVISNISKLAIKIAERV